jgi:hypothetical protein
LKGTVFVPPVYIGHLMHAANVLRDAKHEDTQSPYKYICDIMVNWLSGEVEAYWSILPNLWQVECIDGATSVSCLDLEFAPSKAWDNRNRASNIGGPIFTLSISSCAKAAGHSIAKVDELGGPTVALIVETRNQLCSIAPEAIEEMVFVDLRRLNSSLFKVQNQTRRRIISDTVLSNTGFFG